LSSNPNILSCIWSSLLDRVLMQFKKFDLYSFSFLEFQVDFYIINEFPFHILHLLSYLAFNLYSIQIHLTIFHTPFQFIAIFFACCNVTDDSYHQSSECNIWDFIHGIIIQILYYVFFFDFLRCHFALCFQICCVFMCQDFLMWNHVIGCNLFISLYNYIFIYLLLR
jgi:hypothetical protein